MLNLIHGFMALFQGTALLSKRGIRRYLVIPLTINITLFVGATWLLMSQFTPMLEGWVADLPAWLAWLDSVLWFLGLVALTLVMFIVVTMLATTIASPFNALLAAAVERHLAIQDGKLLESEIDNPVSMTTEILFIIIEELRKLRYQILRSLPLLLLFLIPVINIAAPFIWAIFSAWMLALTYFAYPAENHRIPFNEQRPSLGKHRLMAYGFGGAVLMFSMIPVVNLLIMPAAVAGATLLFYRKEMASQVTQ